MPRSARVTIFRWGYEGWGNATKTFVRSVDAVERERGYDPPIFVDIRYSRSVRAIGFRDHAFEKLQGHVRYRWMRSLGNVAIRTGRGPMRIQCPDAAQQLLDLALDAAAANKRVIFFCSCPSPDHEARCHRTKVGKLLVRAARGRGIHLDVDEWPGGLPTSSAVRRIPVSATELRKVLNGAVALPLAKRQAADMVALPFGALVELVSPGGRQLASVGPAQYRARRWQLPIFLFPVEEGDTASNLVRWRRRRRSEWNLDVLRS